MSENDRAKYLRTGGDIDWERLKNPDLDFLEVAMNTGDCAPLAEYLRGDGALHSDTREWIARHLLGELPSKRSGRRAKHETSLERWRLLARVVVQRARYGYSQTQVLEAYADERDESFDTVNSRLKRAKKQWPFFDDKSEGS